MKKVLNIIILLFLTSGAFALDVRDFTFSHIGIHEGIVNQRVFSLTKTTDGAIWWTTKRDVGRTNGATVSNYRLAYRKTYASFAGRVVKFASYTNPAIQDSLFVFDDNGHVYHFIKNQNAFELRYSMEKYLGSEIVVEDVLATDNGMFIAMREGLYYVSLRQGSGQALSNPKPVAIIKGLYCNAIIPLKDSKGRMLSGQILVATNKGLMLAQLGNNDVLKNKRYIYNGYVCSALYDNATRELWIGTLDCGVKKKKWSSAIWSDVAGVPHNPVRSLAFYGRTMLIGIDGYGVYQCNRNGPVARLFADANDGRQGVLHGNGIYSILVGNWNSIVIGSYSGGIDIARPVGSTTAIFQHVVNSDQSISNDHVNCVGQLDADHLLMGTDNGLSIFDSQNSVWSNVARGIVVLDICKYFDKLSNRKRLLLATYGKGVCEVGGDGTAHTIYSHAEGILKDDHVYRLLYDRYGNLWIGCLFGPLTEITPSGPKYYNVDNVQTLLELHDGRIAVGSAKGLFMVRPGDRNVRMLKYAIPGSEVNRYVLDLYEDSQRNLWIATDGGGVYVYNLKNGKCFQITKYNGLPSNSVHSIIRDRKNRIWFGTEKGLAFINSQDLKTVKPKVIDVNYCNGVRTEYARGSACNLVKGHILFGTVDGARIVDPQYLQELNYTAPLRLLRVQCADVDTSGVYEFNEQVAEMLSKGKLKLSYAQRSFELYFESINMRNHFDIAYQYKMDNGDWSDPSEQEYIRFVNLEPGKHHLSIRCVSETGGAVLDTKELTIIISQPWWNSWWMWIIYIAILISAFYGAWRVYDLQARYKKLVMERINGGPLTSQGGSELCSPEHQWSARALNTVNPLQATEQLETPPLGDGGLFVNKATKIVLDNLKDTDFTIDTLCREIAMSRTLFYLKVKSYTGKSPQDFVRMIRLERAAAMLKQGRSVGEVATLTGFDNPKYFSVVFKKYFSITPSQYKA